MRTAVIAVALVLAAAVTAMPIADELKAGASVAAVDDPQTDLNAWCEGAGALTPECGGFLGGIVWFGTKTNCTFTLLDNETDKTKVVAPVTVCEDHRTGHGHGRGRSRHSNSAPGFTAFDNPTKQILYVTGDGSYVYGVSVNNGKQTQLAALPQLYAQVLALAVANGVGLSGAWYVVTVNELMQITPASASGGSGTVQSVMDLSSLELTAGARVTAYNTTLFIVDRTYAYVIDLLGLQVTDTVSIAWSGLSASQTLQYWMTNATLITVSADRVVTQIDLSGRAYPMLTLPAGSGAVNRATNFADMYFVTDNVNMFLLNLSAKKLETTAPWPGAQTSSNIQYYF